MDKGNKGGGGGEGWRKGIREGGREGGREGNGADRVLCLSGTNSTDLTAAAIETLIYKIYQDSPLSLSPSLSACLTSVWTKRAPAKCARRVRSMWQSSLV